MNHVPLSLALAGLVLTVICAGSSFIYGFTHKEPFFRLVLITGIPGLTCDFLNLFISFGRIDAHFAQKILFYMGMIVLLACLAIQFLHWITSHTRKPVLLYGSPKTGRINPSDLQEPERCSLCSCTFDSGPQLRIELKKDGYGDCTYCPRCGRELTEG